MELDFQLCAVDSENVSPVRGGKRKEREHERARERAREGETGWGREREIKR